MEEKGASQASRLAGVVRAHPLIVGVIVGCTLAGAVLGVLLLPEGWTLARRLVGGMLGGAGCGVIITAPRIVG